MKAENGGSEGWPCLYTKQMCWSMPWMDMTSFHQTFDFVSIWKDCVLSKYFRHFLSGSKTIQFCRSHKKPTYIIEDTKSCPLDSIGCHGMLRGTVTERIVMMFVE